MTSSQSSGMDVSERYRAEHGQVLLDGPGEAYPRLIADCTTDRDAERIVRALNQPRGAVDPSDEAVCEFIEAWAHDYANDDWRALSEADQLRVGRAMIEVAHTATRGAV